jgi:hypothetical protein
MFASMVAAIGVAALSALTLAQPPGGGPPGGGPPGGGPGGGFGGFGGMFGGPGGFGGRGGGGNIWGLLDYTAVQEDLKLTDKQKDQLKTAKEQVDALRKAAFPNRGQGGPGGNAAPGGNRGNRRNRGGGNGAPGGGGAPGAAPAGPNGFILPVAYQPPDPNAQGGQGGQGGGRGNRGGGQGGPGGPGGPGGFNRAQFQETMQQLQLQTEAVYKKILTKSQNARLHEIDLRRQGTMAIVQRPEIAEKLNVDEDTIALIRQDIQAVTQPQREQMKAAMQKFMTPDPNGGRPQFDRNAMQAYMQSDEGKTATAKAQEQMKDMPEQLKKAIAKHLTKRQRQNFDKMLGKPFDITKIQGPPPGGNATPAVDAAKSDTATDKADDTPAPTKKSTRKGSSKKKSTTSSSDSST